jgi:hypothetical protein
MISEAVKRYAISPTTVATSPAPSVRRGAMKR